MSDASKETDFAKKLKQLQDMEGNTQVQHLAVEFALLFVGCFAGWLLLGHWQLAAWFCITYSLMLTDRWLLFRDCDLTPKSRYVQHLFLTSLTASFSNMLPVFLWFQEELVYQFVALTYLSCAILNTFLVRTMSLSLTLCYLIPNSSVLLLIALSFFWSDVSTIEAWLCVLIACFAIGYLASSFLESLRQHRQIHYNQQRIHALQKFETLGNLSAGMAHDFNNILGTISGNLELLNDEVISERAERLISSGLLATERAASLTDQLSHFGGGFQLRTNIIAMASFFDELSEALNQIVPQGVSLGIDVDHGVGDVDVDEGAFRTAIVKLVENSVDAIDEHGQISIKVQDWTIGASFEGCLQTKKVTTNNLMISITDTGSGIQHDVLQSVFDPYYSSKKTGEGSGLSLAMVLGFVKQAGGDLRITSKVDKGTTVYILLPSVPPKPSSDPTTRVVTGINVRKGPKSTVAPAHLLIVEDEPELLSVLSQKFLGQGYRISTATCGDEALECLTEQAHLDLVLTDVVMPGKIQGLELVEIIGKKFVGTKFIVMSGYAPPNTSISDVVRGRSIILKKPVPLQLLSNSVAKLLGTDGVSSDSVCADHVE